MTASKDKVLNNLKEDYPMLSEHQLEIIVAEAVKKIEDKENKELAKSVAGTK